MNRLVIGLGHRFRSDDAAGRELARRLPGALEVETASYELIDAWRDSDDVVVVDALRSGAPPGTVRRFDPIAEPLPAGTFASSHSVGLAETVEMARALDALPLRMVVYGIEAGNIDHGEGLTAEVEAAVARLVEELADA